MGSTIRIKRSEVSGNPSTLGIGELAYSNASADTIAGGDRLYIGMGTDTGAGNASNHVVIGGKYFTDMLDHTKGVLNASSAIITDSNSKIDQLLVDNIKLDLNTISTTDLNGNLNIQANGTGNVKIDTTNSLVIPVGDTTQRGTAITGAIRYNTTISGFEGYVGTAGSGSWSSLGGVKSVDGKAYIIAENSPANGDDTLQFYASSDGTSLGASTKYLDLNGTGFKLNNTNLYVNTDKFVVQYTSGDTNIKGITTIENTTDSTVYTNGALVVLGGIGITKNLNVHGAVDFDSTLNVDGIATISNTTESTVVTDGALIIKGGVGIAKKLNIGGITTITDVTDSSAVTNGALIVSGGVGIAKNLTVGGVVSVTNTTESTAYTNGSTVIQGGVGIAKNLNVHGNATFDADVTIPAATKIGLGTPNAGSLLGAITMNTTTSVTDGIAQLNLVLRKLVPTMPPNFPNNTSINTSTTLMRIAKSAANQTLNNNTINTTRTPGSSIPVSRASTFSLNSITGTGPGDSGTINVIRNNTSVLSRPLRVGNSTAPLVNTTIIGTTLNSPDVILGPINGVIVAGHILKTGSSGAFGGLNNSTTYYVKSILGNIATLQTYNDVSGATISDFNATSTATGSLTFTAAAEDLVAYTTNNTTLSLNNNKAYPTTSPGFWETVDITASGTNVPAGWNTVQLTHSGAGNTNVFEWYYDASNPIPVATPISITPPAVPSLTYSSKIPHYNSSNQFTLTYTCSKLSGDCYPTSNTFATGTAGGAFGTPISNTYGTNGIPSTLPDNDTTTYNVTTTAPIISGFGQSSNMPSMTIANGYNTTNISFNPNNIILYKTGTTSSTTVIDESNIWVNSPIGTGTGLVSRVVNPDDGYANVDTPVFTAGSALFDSQNATLLATDATVVGTGTGTHAIKHDLTNYSTGYLPVGPDLSGRTAGNAQYFTFRFNRTGISTFKITLTTNGRIIDTQNGVSGLAGMWVAMPGAQGTLSKSNALNGWLDLTKNSELPTGAATGGDLVLTGDGTRTVTVSFGTVNSSNATNNEIWIRIKLMARQSISSLYLSA